MACAADLLTAYSHEGVPSTCCMFVLALRRSCNTAYVLWVTALCLCTIILCLATELLAPQPLGRPAASASLQLLNSINRNMLALFLAANLLTGAINLSINTLAVGDWEARGVVGKWLMNSVCMIDQPQCQPLLTACMSTSCRNSVLLCVQAVTMFDMAHRATCQVTAHLWTCPYVPCHRCLHARRLFTGIYIGCV